ncbi:Membrane associated serine protease, rhomboid family [Halogranum gelatinilyticum]|uniref:Membrane associated serine protease, rhomboid family n=2 Tax=Halogranum gelatinilyticum TaxID=660521 RepID=A0A1G9TSZ6_9EURY|nr:rhomboid family intramembrane serine protease [Halogranum gelatinilyticum]SDM50849.1 Membrane associated serine protease, rhomboid family [Halogranum gelatinilyticum]
MSSTRPHTTDAGTRPGVDSDPPDSRSLVSRALLGNPVVETLAAMAVVSLLTWTAALVGLTGLFVLAPPVLSPPWALVTSVYAHAGPGHLVSNAVVVAVAGSLVAWSTTRLRFHAFFLTTGVLAGLAQVWLGGLFAPGVGVLGASGAAFALVGYVLAANPVSSTLLDRFRLPPRVTVLLVAVVAGGLTLLFSAPGSALVAHLTGAVLGLVAGRLRLLRV